MSVQIRRKESACDAMNTQVRVRCTRGFDDRCRIPHVGVGTHFSGRDEICLYQWSINSARDVVAMADYLKHRSATPLPTTIDAMCAGRSGRLVSKIRTRSTDSHAV
jgi:hypothetical protein